MICYIGDESIATTRNCLDEIAIRSQRLAQRRNLELKIVLLDHHPRPHAAQELVLGDKSAPRFDQSDENIEGPATDRDGQPIREKLTAVRIETKAAKFHQFRASNDPG